MRRPFWIILALSALCIGPAQIAAQERWTSLTTPHFQMYTTAAQNQAVETLRFLEGVECFFSSTSPFRAGASARPPVRVVAFSSEREYAPYAVREIGNGYFAHTFNGYYIVLGNLAAQNRELAAHEYTHFVIDSAGLKLPVWLNEGLAEFYSSVEVGEKQVTLGRPLPRSLKTIHQQKLIPWNVLFTADIHSPYYADANKVFLFYAQSWALVHMLALDKAYSAQFPDFLSAVSAGAAPADALRRTYHKDMQGIEADLLSYLNQKNLPVAVLANTQDVSTIQPVAAEASDFQIQFALADLLASRPGSLAEAEQKLAALSARYPQNPEPEEALGELALREQHKEEARTHFATAVQRHSRNAELYQQYAGLLQEAGANNVEVKSMLQRAVEIKPDFELARVELGLLEADDRDFESALPLLSAAKVIPPEYEYEVYFALAECNANLDHSAEALRYANKAKQAARNDAQRNEVQNLLAELARN